jgi:Arc/MetJ-type ribon-helix-helix transcriptional regulator
MIFRSGIQEINRAELERLTIIMPRDLAAVVKTAVAESDYASTSEVVREALRLENQVCNPARKLLPEG